MTFLVSGDCVLSLNHIVFIENEKDGAKIKRGKHPYVTVWLATGQCRLLEGTVDEWKMHLKNCIGYGLYDCDKERSCSSE